MLDRTKLSLSSNVCLTRLSIECRTSLIRSVIERCCVEHEVDPFVVISEFRGTRKEQNARSAIIFVLIELGMRRDELASILQKDYDTLGTNLYRTHTKANKCQEYAARTQMSINSFADITLEALWGESDLSGKAAKFELPNVKTFRKKKPPLRAGEMTFGPAWG